MKSIAAAKSAMGAISGLIIAKSLPLRRISPRDSEEARQRQDLTDCGAVAACFVGRREAATMPISSAMAA